MVKEAVRNFWDAAPCGTKDITLKEGTRAYFSALEERRYRLEPFIARFAQFTRWRGKRVLEIGCGPGVDLVQFSWAGAKVSGIDISPHSVDLAQKWLSISGCTAEVQVGDAERLPYEDGQFDFVYSWGVLHHTPDTRQAVSEIYRVLKPGAQVCIMLYHKHSLVVLQAWLIHGLMACRPWRCVTDILAVHMESPGTRAFTRREMGELFSDFSDITIETIVTPYDVRLARRLFLPDWARRLVPARFGWFLVVQGRKK